MSNVDEAQRIIEEMRAKRAALGDTTKVDVPKVHYKRLKRPKLASVVLFGYTFVSGMLFATAILTGYVAVWICFILIVIVMGITHLRE